MPRRFFNSDRKILVLGNTPDKRTSVCPEGSAISVSEACPNAELNSIWGPGGNCAQVSTPRFSGFMTRTLGTSKLRHSCFISIVHPLFESDDDRFGVDEAFQLQ